MRLVDAAEPTFARHETFHPRYGWFRKAYVHGGLDPHVFGRDDAPVVLGVGKNMVRSIRFWGLAAKVIVEDPESPGRSPVLVPTRIGHALFGKDGWDAYMEDPGTLWLLHWLLLAPPSRLPVWWLAFNEVHAVEFTDEDLAVAVEMHLEAASEWADPHPRSVQKDISALLRTYAPVERSGRSALDDLLDCPMRELGLIARSPATSNYRFSIGSKPTLPPEVVAYACLDYIARADARSTTMTVSRLAQEPGGPGHAFKLTEADIVKALQAVSDRHPTLSLMSPTGATQLAWTAAPELLAVELLDDYYGAEVEGVAAGPSGDAPVDDDVLEELGLGREPSETLRRLLGGVPR